MSIELVMPCNYLILCRPLLPPLIFPSIRVFSDESGLHIRWPKYWSFSFSISPSNEYSGLISFRMDCLDLLAVQGTLESFPTPQYKSINSLALSFLYSPTLTSIHDYSIDKDIQYRQRQLLYKKDDFTGRGTNRSGLKTGERIPRKWLWLKDRILRKTNRKEGCSRSFKERQQFCGSKGAESHSC